MTAENWQDSLRFFFSERAEAVEGVPSLADLCLISGRDPRLWADSALYDELIEDIVRLCGLGPTASVLEVGCAAGFLARGVAPRVGKYVGVDVARPPLRVAKRLGLRNVSFRASDGARLDFKDGSFDAAFCYDVFTNFPQFASGELLIAEMMRVVRAGGRILVGSVPDRATRAAFERTANEVGRLLEERHGPIAQPPVAKRGVMQRIWRGISRPKVAPGIVCYYFDREDFVRTAKRFGVRVTIEEVHARNPYRGYRFNSVYEKPEP